jgi:hypothetical protein
MAFPINDNTTLAINRIMASALHDSVAATADGGVRAD